MAAGIVHGCEGSGSVQTLNQSFFDPDFRWMVMANTAAVEGGFGAAGECSGQDTAFPEPLEGAAIQGFLRQH